MKDVLVGMLMVAVVVFVWSFPTMCMNVSRIEKHLSTLVELQEGNTNEVIHVDSIKE